MRPIPLRLTSAPTPLPCSELVILRSSTPGWLLAKASGLGEKMGGLEVKMGELEVTVGGLEVKASELKVARVMTRPDVVVMKGS